MAIRPSRVAGVIAGCAVLVGVVAPAASAQMYPGTAGADRATVDGSTPAWATPQAKVGGVDGKAQRHIEVALQLRDQSGAEALARAVSTPGSPSYGQHLSSQQFNQRFAATDQTVAQVSSWLRGQGLRVTAVSGNHHFIDASGDNATLERAFGTQLATYRHTSKDGKTRDLVAPQSAVSLPRQIRADISAVVGLDDSDKTIVTQQVIDGGPRLNTGVKPSAANGSDQSCARYWAETNNSTVPQKYGAGDQSNILCGYLTGQMRSIYGLSAGNTGAGVNVGIVGAYNLVSVADDTNRAAKDFGNTPLAPGQYTAVLPDSFNNTPDCEGPDAWAGEQALDVQAVHTMAPAAKITYYAGKDCEAGIYEALNTAVQQNTVAVITNSWLHAGEDDVPQATRDQLNAITVQAAIQGQAVLFCSGDSGDNSGLQPNAQPSFPASNPFVTAVGGTAVALDANGKTKFVTGWEDSGNVLSGGQWSPLPDKQGHFAGGSGGGISHIYSAPDYQSGVVPASAAGGHRAVPDISTLASAYTGMAIGYTGAQGYFEYSSGGTSLASPLLAGLVADAQQSQKVSRLGFLNPAIYSLAGTSAITDVTAHPSGIWTPGMDGFGGVPVPTTRGDYLIDFDSHPQSLQSGKGWDAVTGVGTPNAEFLTQLGK
jgi:subtilase family serine protease